MAALVCLLLMLAMVGGSDAAWCVCRSDLSDSVLQKTLDYACGAGADCNPTLQNGVCYNPSTVRSHCSYAVNSYYQRKGQAQGACDFSGTATLTSSDPSASGCTYPATPSIYLMAGLVTRRINPICLSNDLYHSALPPFILKHLPESSFRISFSVTRSYKPLTIVAASVHHLGAQSATQFDNTLPSREVLEIWRSADAVCFDVDSTVCLDEGIDELADFCGAGKAVAEWTTKAMSGSVPFEEALAARLSLFNPSLPQLHDFLDKRPPRISPGITELINKLKATSTDVYLISGGFRQMINPVALQLGIPLDNIFANQLLFGSSGEFLGFDTTEFTSRSGGKATAVQHIRKIHVYKALVMIGDGATDLEARKPGGADLFICYGGVQLREAVAAKADWLVFNFQELLSSLE